ncbi:MAG: hypothetical protein DMG05_24890 [Acidobacteria bacterium]|nr:MAG: hypothetical protein DMG05_24890 [Acidobacteriota bacterium]
MKAPYHSQVSTFSVLGVKTYFSQITPWLVALRQRPYRPSSHRAFRRWAALGVKNIESVKAEIGERYRVFARRSVFPFRARG